MCVCVKFFEFGRYDMGWCGALKAKPPAFEIRQLLLRTIWPPIIAPFLLRNHCSSRKAALICCIYECICEYWNFCTQFHNEFEEFELCLRLPGGLYGRNFYRTACVRWCERGIRDLLGFFKRYAFIWARQRFTNTNAGAVFTQYA